MRRLIPICVVFFGCASTDLEAELRRVKLERDQAVLEAQRARLTGDQAKLDAQRTQMLAAQELARAKSACKEEPPPPDPATLPATVVQGKFKFKGGKSTVVTMHVAGMGIDESFTSDKKGRIAIELPVGSYSMSLKAKGYREKLTPLDVPAKAEGERYEFTETLDRK
jgi:multidrug efflux pump subunit AcrA (membrane-fusion protein)